ncbi:MAG: hypothetical protein GXY33_09670 [Phycisphaerae bacterium]|nr:hypothetical protein [Phycisphaerae bacterium]
MKTVIKIALVGFVIVSVGYLIAQEADRPESCVGCELPKGSCEQCPSATTQAVRGTESGSDQPASQPAEETRKLIVYYFHTSQRCVSCLKIEKYTRLTLENGYREGLESGRIAFRQVNVEEPEHRHFVKDYELYTKSVVLVEEVNGEQRRWENLPEVWTLLGDQAAFGDYVRSRVNDYLEAP